MSEQTEYQRLVIPLFDHPIKGCIKHWETLLEGKSHNTTPDGINCSLCLQFTSMNEAHNSAGKDYCEGCPISLRTGRIDCNGTPYFNARRVWDVEAPVCPPTASYTEAVKAMLDYLKETREMVASGELVPA